MLPGSRATELTSDRRYLAALSIGGATAISLMSGCLTFPFTEDDSNPNLEVSGDVPFQVQLVGPETDKRLFSGPEVTLVGSIQETRTGGYRLSINVSERAIEEFEEVVQSAGVAETLIQFEIV